jgi:hypothetical protein
LLSRRQQQRHVDTSTHRYQRIDDDVVPTYRGHRIEVNAVAVDGRYNAEVRILRLFSRDKPHVETVTCLKLTPELAEYAGELLGEAMDRSQCEGAW